MAKTMKNVPPSDFYLKWMDRTEKKTAATNRENEALREEVRKLRLANYILQQNYANSESGGYRIRYEKLVKNIQTAREVLKSEVNGIPDSVPETLEPWLGPDYLRKRKK